MCPECSFGDEQLLALMLHQDRAIGLEAAPQGPLRGEFDLLLLLLGGRQAGVRAGRTPRLDGGLKDGQALVVVHDVALAGGDSDSVLLAVSGVYLVGAGAAVQDVFAAAARQQRSSRKPPRNSSLPLSP